MYVKQKAFRFCKATVDNLSEMVNLGIVRNETEAIDLSVMHFLIEKKMEIQSRGKGKGPGSGFEPTVMSMADVLGVNQQARA